MPQRQEKKACLLISHPGVPEELGEDDQVGRVQREAHVGRRDGQNGHAGLGRVLEPFAQLLPLGRRRVAVDTDVADVLRWWGEGAGCGGG